MTITRNFVDQDCPGKWKNIEIFLEYSWTWKKLWSEMGNILKSYKVPYYYVYTLL